MATKTYTVQFYQASMLPPENSDIKNFGELLSKLSDENRIKEFKTDKTIFQLRELDETGSSFKGVLAKFREGDLPHIGSRSTLHERPILMEDGEGLIEKNYFLYDKRYHLLTFQVNGNGCNINQVGNLFTFIAEMGVRFNPVLRADAIERIISGGLSPIKYQVSMARPSNPDILPDDNFSGPIMNLLNGVGGYSCSITVSANPPGRSKTRQFLDDIVKAGMTNLTSSASQVNLAKIWFDEESDPVDLIADRIISSTGPVEMEGKYPSPESIFHELHEAKNRRLDEIRSVIDPDYGNEH